MSTKLSFRSHMVVLMVEITISVGWLFKFLNTVIFEFTHPIGFSLSIVVYIIVGSGLLYYIDIDLERVWVLVILATLKGVLDYRDIKRKLIKNRVKYQP